VNKIEELDKLDKILKDSEIRLKSIQSSIEQNSKEISTLSLKKNELEQNIEFHKKDGTIPIANEYKKSKIELSKTKARLILINSDLKKAQQVLKNTEMSIEKVKKDYEELSKVNENNVLRVLFGGDRGKK
jgi:chromosome segregation ATPase